MPAPDITPPPAIHADDIESPTDHGDHTGEEPRIEVPMPPAVDSSGNPTTNFGYEQKVAIWRARITDLFYANRREIRQYRVEEDQRHTETMAAIEGRGKAWVAFWEWMKASTTACVSGVLDIVKTLASNENGQLKYFALVLIGLAAIANGIAFSGLGFSAESAVKCGRGTVEHDGRCELETDGADGAGDAELIETGEPAP